MMMQNLEYIFLVKEFGRVGVRPVIILPKDTKLTMWY